LGKRKGHMVSVEEDCMRHTIRDWLEVDNLWKGVEEFIIDSTQYNTSPHTPPIQLAYFIKIVYSEHDSWNRFPQVCAIIKWRAIGWSIVSCLLNIDGEVVDDKPRSFKHKYSPLCKKENYYMWIPELWKWEPILPLWARPARIRCAISWMVEWSSTQNQSHMYPPRFFIEGHAYVNAFFME
jgi:hypothetical protein